VSEPYDLFTNGMRLLEAGDFHAATIALSRVRELEPGKDSIHEAYGRALFGAQRYREAAEEFAAITEHAPTDHYALFCLGRSLQQLGRHAEARAPLAQAAHLRPERGDYALYRDRAFREAA
jgi:Flp pilus assembly protein TadD